ncbi:MAG: META domain-containing protein [Phycisphaeraceae bacterium]|nr:META domain-containing protein [Phycisphaeraceae bacterium]
MKQLLPIAVVLASLSFASGCATAPEAEAPGAAQPAMSAPGSMRPLVGKWTVVSIGGRDMSTVERAPELEFTMMGGAVGFTGVNRYSTRATVGVDGALTIAPGVTTMMAGTPEAMAVEAAFLNAMNTANGVLVGEGLLAFTRDGKTVMVLRREGSRE